MVLCWSELNIDPLKICLISVSLDYKFMAREIQSYKSSHERNVLSKSIVMMDIMNIDKMRQWINYLGPQWRSIEVSFYMVREWNSKQAWVLERCTRLTLQCIYKNGKPESGLHVFNSKNTKYKTRTHEQTSLGTTKAEETREVAWRAMFLA